MVTSLGHITDDKLEPSEICNWETLFYNCSSALEQDPGLAVQTAPPLFQLCCFCRVLSLLDGPKAHKKKKRVSSLGFHKLSSPSLSVRNLRDQSDASRVKRSDFLHK